MEPKSIWYAKLDLHHWSILVAFQKKSPADLHSSCELARRVELIRAGLAQHREYTRERMLQPGNTNSYFSRSQQRKKERGRVQDVNGMSKYL